MKQPPHSSLPRIPFTKIAFTKMQSERVRLNKEREETLERLKTAREQGDLSENGAYRYAKMELGNIGRQQRQLNYLLRFGKVVENQGDTKIVNFGSTVTLKSADKDLVYMIVSVYEADPANGKLSTESPIGRAVFGKKLGDKIIVSAPIGLQEFLLTKIE